MTWVLTTSGEALAKAGYHYNPDLTTSGALAGWSNQAEGRIVAETRRNWVSQYAGLSEGIKRILSDIASSLIAKQIISCDMSGYTSRSEAQTMLDVQDDVAETGIRILKDFKSGEIKDT